MNIRTRLSLYFTLISSCLLLIVLACVYYLLNIASREEFYHRLQERIGFAAGVYLEADEISDTSLKKLREKFIATLPQEEIRFYDSSNRRAFIKTEGYDWSPEIIDKVRDDGYMEYQSGNIQVVGRRYMDNQGIYVILASAVDVNGKNRRMTLMKIMVTLFLLQIFIQFVAGRWFAARILQPIQHINSQVQTITATDLHKRLDEGDGDDEIGMLAHNFNNLLARIEGAFDTHKMFIANASHELKTPLTGIMGEIEVSLSKERTCGEYRNTLQSILAETDRLHVIVETLLLLAYEESGQSAQVFNPLRIDDLLWEMQEQFNRDGKHRLSIIMTELPANENMLKVRGNKTLLMLAMTNIVRNAFKYSAGKDVNVCLLADEKSVRISITDEGIGISQSAMKHIFEPFYRSTIAEGYQGSGIGLYVANRIVTLYGGYIEVVSQINKGSIFTIILPAEPNF